MRKPASQSLSDVLFRHCKGHAQNALNKHNNNQQNQQTRQEQLPSRTGLAADSSTQPSQNPGSEAPSELRSPHQLLPGPEGSQIIQQAPTLHAGASGTQQPSPGDSRLEALLNAAQHLGTPADVPWRSPSPITLPADNEHFAAPTQDNMPPPADPSIDMLSFSPQAHVSSLDQWAFELVQSNHPLPDRTPAGALQTWLFPLENDILTTNGPHHMSVNGHFDHDMFRNEGENNYSPSSSSVSIASRIPKERFSRVENCWPTRFRAPARLMPSLWGSLVSSDCSNILSEVPSGSTETPFNERERRNSRWGLDHECRELLLGALNNAPRASSLQSDSFGDSASSSGEAGASPGGEGIRFPPAEILDIALEMYLYYFHPTLPVIHIPTFSAKSTLR